MMRRLVLLMESWMIGCSSSAQDSCHLFCHLKATGNWLASVLLLIQTPPTCSVLKPQHEISFPTAWNSVFTIRYNEAHLACCPYCHFHCYCVFKIDESVNGVTVRFNVGDLTVIAWVYQLVSSAGWIPPYCKQTATRYSNWHTVSLDVSHVSEF